MSGALSPLVCVFNPSVVSLGWWIGSPSIVIAVALEDFTCEDVPSCLSASDVPSCDGVGCRHVFVCVLPRGERGSSRRCEFKFMVSDCPSFPAVMSRRVGGDMGSEGMSIILLSVGGRKSFEGDGGLKPAASSASSGSSPIEEMEFGAIGCGVVELPTVSLPLAVATGSDPLGGGTKLPAARGDATDALLVTPPMDGSGVGASSIADCVIPFVISSEDVG